MSERLYQVQEFAARCGVTVRALHHYDHLGLLKPTMYAESGYRYYSDRDLARLQQIVTLKFIGLSLKQIGEMLDGDAFDGAAMLRSQRAALEERRRQLDMAIRAIDSAERITAGGGEPGRELLTQIIEAVTMENNNELFRKYYTEEQMAAFAERAAANPDEARKGQRDWQELIAEVEASLGEDPAGERGRELATRWAALIKAFTLGNPETEKSLKHFYADSANWPASFKKPYSDEVEEFIGKALKAWNIHI
jgi:DNA-binding transcriptional MerR regulator